MNKIKELYSSPTTKILVVRFEGSILSMSTKGGGFAEPNAEAEDASDQNWWN